MAKDDRPKIEVVRMEDVPELFDPVIEAQIEERIRKRLEKLASDSVPKT